MLRLRHSLARPFRKPHKAVDSLVQASATDEPRAPYTPSLPAELWLLIIAHIEHSADLFSLALVSSTLRTLVISSFKALHLYPLGQVATKNAYLSEFRVLKALRSTVLAHYVKELHITLSCFPAPLMPSAPWRQRCTCISIDFALGHALKAMVNLEVLDILCIMCHCDTHRHQYLATLEARPHLRTVSFRCRCGAYTHMPLWGESRIPLFDNAQSLRWSPGVKGVYLHSPSEPALVGSGPPKLRSLAYHGNEIEIKLLAATSVQRLYIIDPRMFDIGRFLKALKTSTNTLTHIIHDTFVDLKVLIVGEASHFVNVQHIGTLPSFPIDDAVSTLTMRGQK